MACRLIIILRLLFIFAGFGYFKIYGPNTDGQADLLRNRQMDEPADLWMDRPKYLSTSVYNYWIVDIQKAHLHIVVNSFFNHS